MEENNSTRKTAEIDINSGTNNSFGGDDFVIGAGFKVDESVDYSAKPAKKHKKKKKGCLQAFGWLGGIIVAAFILAAVFLISTADYFGIGINRGRDCMVDIKQGMTTKQIAAELEKVDAVSSPLFFRLFTKIKGFDGTYKYGVYTFNNEIGYESLAKMLQTEGAKAETVKVTVPEQANVETIGKLLEEKGVCTASQFKEAVNNGKIESELVDDIPEKEVRYRLEGYLFPDTYEFYSYDSDKCGLLAVQKMVEQLEKNITSDMEKQAKKIGRSMHEILTMASIIELEASGKPEEMKNVSAVFYNRLKWDEPKLLGSSPTAKYAKMYNDSRYDTNKTEGLPPGPLCSPSKDAIMAALYPTEDFKATYFVTDANMNFYYTYSLSEHQQTISRLKSKGIWLG